jgi:uncharacterized protein (TIGR03663 family)
VTVLTLVAVGLFARIAGLGYRIAHWDEARVAYWVDYARESGSFAYRHIIHGPFIQHADRYLFELLGTSDFVARLPVAVVGALLPLVALLFRERLRDDETVALAFFLAANPALLYYSRFMRSDVLVGTFMLATLGFLIRFLDTRQPRYLWPAALALAFGFASKENAILYLVTWAGASVLLLDRNLVRVDATRSPVTRTIAWAREQYRRNTPLKARARSLARAYGGHVLGSVLVFALVTLFMFAPRGAGIEGMQYPPATAEQGAVGLWQALGDPASLPSLVGQTVSQIRAEYLSWGGGASSLTVDQYQTRLLGMLGGLVRTSLALVALAGVGVVRERYGVADSRPLVLFAAYAAVASLVGYPLGFSINSGWKWNMIHVLLPLSIPAAVGFGIVIRWGREAIQQDDPVDVGLSTLVAVLVVGLVVTTGFQFVYQSPQTDANPLVQFGQPSDDMRPALDRIERISSEQGGPHVLIYDDPSPNDDSDRPYVRSVAESTNESVSWNFRPVCSEWSNMLPLNWYFAADDIEATCARSEADVRAKLESDSIPVIVTRGSGPDVPQSIAAEYDRYEYSIRYDDGHRMAIYVRSTAS